MSPAANALLLEHPLVLLLLAIFALYLLRVVLLMREGIRHALRAVVVAVCLMIATGAFAPKFGLKGNDAEAAAVLVGSMAIFAMPKRSRHIPTSVKRRVIEKHIRGGGKYDPKQDELDHRVPFSRFGGHTEDNLRVVPRKVNRKKGAKMPKLGELF